MQAHVWLRPESSIYPSESEFKAVITFLKIGLQSRFS
jgi:hypothetical protein